MYVRTYDIRDAMRQWLPSTFLPKHGGGTLGTSRQFATIITNNYIINHGLLSASHNSMYFLS